MGHNEAFPAPKAHLLLLLLSASPLLLEVPTNANIILTALLAVFVGCWRSVKTAPPSESLSHKDAMRFPIVGSAVLFSLFLLYKFLPKDIVNAILGAYFVFLGTLATTGALLPFLSTLFSKAFQDKVFNFNLGHIPYLCEPGEPVRIEITLPEVVVGLPCAAFSVWYYFSRHWFANNVLGLSFSITGIEHLSLGSVQTGLILLSGLFFYDIFWVFCTPVMVSVAKSFDAPVKLLFPRHLDDDSKQAPFAMLGLGDIVIPGIFVALMLRYDVSRRMKSRYFQAAFFGYAAGLVATIVVMNVFQAAQPALLYIVPGVLGAVGALALAKKEAKEFFRYAEEVSEPQQTTPASGDATEDKKDN